MNQSHIADPHYNKSDADEIIAVADRYIEIINKRSSQTALQPMTHKFFICPVGLLGSGKSTVLKQLESKLPFVRVSGDEIRELIYREDGDQRIAWQVGARVVQHYVELNLNIAHDTDCATPATIENVEHLAKEFGYKIYWVHITTPVKFIENKLRNYPHTYLFRNADEAIARLHEREETHKSLPSLSFIHTVDVSSEGFHQEVDMLALKIRNNISSE
jgi:predicted kinase